MLRNCTNMSRVHHVQAKCAELAAAVTAYKHPPPGYEHVKIIGFIDGTTYRILKPGDPAIQRKYSNVWKHLVCVSNIFVFLPDGTIAWANVNNFGTLRGLSDVFFFFFFPSLQLIQPPTTFVAHRAAGSTHDSGLCKKLYEKIEDETKTPPGYSFLADTAFKSTGVMEGRVYKPMKNRTVVRGTPAQVEAREEFDRWVISVRQAVEWGMGNLQAWFPRLTVPLPSDVAKRARLLTVITLLHNLKTRAIGLNRIKSVFLPYLLTANSMEV